MFHLVLNRCLDESDRSAHAYSQPLRLPRPYRAASKEFKASHILAASVRDNKDSAKQRKE